MSATSQRFQDVCCMPEATAVYVHGRIGARIARDMGIRDEDAARDLQARILDLVVASWPCSHHEALEPGDHPGAVTAGQRPRIGKALQALRDAGEDQLAHAERKLADVLRDAVGDTPRLRAAGSPYTCQTRRVVEEVLEDTTECALATQVIVGLQAYAQAPAARWVLKAAAPAETASYLVGVIAGKDRGGDDAQFRVLAGMSVEELTPYVVTARAALERLTPERWSGLVREALGVLARSLDAELANTDCPDGYEKARMVNLTAHPDTGDGAGWCPSAELRRREALELALHRAQTEEEFAAILDWGGYLPVDPEQRATQLVELRPHWRRYRCDLKREETRLARERARRSHR